MSTDAIPYYRAALSALRFIEQRRPTDHRFGPEADAIWGAFRGHLQSIDRIDLLIRDADAQWPGALGARTVFGFDAVAEDEAFGPDWEGLDPVDAEELFRAELARPAPTSVAETLAAMASAWGLSIARFDVGAIDASEKLVAIGVSAFVALALAFDARQGELDFTDQVVCVASRPGDRQLAAAVSALVRSRGAQVLSSLDPDLAALVRGRRVVAAGDADPEELARVGAAVGS